MVVEVVGGLLAGSLGLIGDAAHLATDALGLGTAPATGRQAADPVASLVIGLHVVVGSDVLNAIGNEKMLHELQGGLGDRFDVAHCTFRLDENRLNPMEIDQVGRNATVRRTPVSTLP